MNDDPFRHTYTPEERERMLAAMETARDQFYASAVRIGVHTYVEMAGFMGEFIKMCRDMHAEGVDFGTTPLRAKPHQLAYIAARAMFIQALGEHEAR
jgi:hypothetical protein